MFGSCPSIDKLESLLREDNRKIAAHVAKCPACQGVMALLAGQTSDPMEYESCAQTELLMAKAHRGELSVEDEARMTEHAAECESCRQLLDFSDE